MLYTTQEIAEMYGGTNKNVTPYMITHTWIPNGLRFIRGKGKGYLFKKEWVEQYIEEQTMSKEKRDIKVFNVKNTTARSVNNTCYVH